MPKTREQIKQEQITYLTEEISKIENAIKVLKEKYQENLSSFEENLEAVKFQKDIFEKAK